MGVMVVSRVGTAMCALPVAHVVETMRPLPIEPLAGMPSFVRGVAIVRGTPIPVVDAGLLLGGSSGGTRFVIVRCGDRRVALLVDAVLAVRAVESVAALPPLVSHDVAVAIGTLDAALVVVLEAARLVPADAWARLEAR